MEDVEGVEVQYPYCKWRSYEANTIKGYYVNSMGKSVNLCPCCLNILQIVDDEEADKVNQDSKGYESNKFTI